MSAVTLINSRYAALRGAYGLALLTVGTHAAVWAQGAAATPVSPEPELLLTLSVELSTETRNAAALVGRAVRTEILTPGDKLDITQRVGQLRKELGINYVAPTNRAGFGLVSHEVVVSETGRFITESKKLTTSQASYRNLWSRPAAAGIWGVGFAAEALKLNNEPDSAPYLREFVSRHGTTSHNLALIGYWVADRRPGNQVLPVGHLDKVNVEWGTPAGNVSYAKLEYQHESYLSVSPRLAAGFSATVGALRGLGGDLTPLTKRYFGGGIGTVRGYQASSLSPTDVSGSGMGANRQILATVEALWHAFDIGETPMILSAFYDYGRFYDLGETRVGGQTLATGRSYGLGVSMPVRIGLVRFMFAKPVEESQRTQRFQFDARANWK